MDGRADPAHGVAEVEDRRLRTELHDIGTDFQNGRDDTQRMKQATGTAIFAVHLLHAVLLWNAPILFP